MQSRLVVGPLAFLAIVGAGELLSLVLGTPREIGPVLAMVVTMLIVLDPAALLAPAGPVGPVQVARPASTRSTVLAQGPSIAD